jgi:N-methylhydantoinase A
MNVVTPIEGQRFRVGIDVGGTFTDVVLVEERTGDILVAKVSTVPNDPSEGCLDGIEKAIRTFSLRPEQFTFTVHGTTIATNTIIEGKSAKAGLITSEGFRDVLEIAYQTRPNLYDIFYSKAKPLIPRHLCLGVPERIDGDGVVLTPLDEAAVRSTARELANEGVQAIAVAFLHSYKDPTHERRCGEIIAEELPHMPVVLSSSISPEYREYPRTSTAVVNAVLLPRVGPYVSRLEERIGERGIRSGLHLMSSSGGIIASSVAKLHPVQLVESGPAAGVIGATFIAQLAGYKNLLALDIGGTTAKAALVNDGEPQIADQFEVGSSAVATVTSPRGQGYPVLTPVLSLVEIGAGGGSVAHVDPGGVLTVGPQSAGAVPGPACYGRGGREPTLTDANVVLGRVNPDYFLGGETKLDIELARSAVRERAAEPAGLGLEAAAQAIIDIANVKMAGALHFISVEQGIDPREYVLVPSGGAGPMQAAAIARTLGVRQVLVPPTPGLNSAVGLLATDLKHELVRTYMKPAAKADAVELAAIFEEMEASILRLLRDENVPAERTRVVREIAMNYVGQSYQLVVPLPDTIDGETWKAMAEAFHKRHAAAYGFANENEPVQYVNLRLTGIGTIDRPVMRKLEPTDGNIARALKTPRQVYFTDAGGWVKSDIYDRSLLRAGDRLAGPAIVEQMDCTTVIPPEVTATVDENGNLMLDIPEARS